MNYKKIPQLISILILFLFAHYFVITASITALIPFSQAYDESPLMVCAWALANGFPLYTPSAFYSMPFYIAKYPPIPYLLQSSLIHFFGITNTPMRFFVIFCATISAFIVRDIVRRLGGGKTASIISALIFFCIEPVSTWIRYANPNLIALFFELCAIYVILAGFTPIRMISFVALLLLSLYTNQSLPAVALAFLVGLFLDGKKLHTSITAFSSAICWGLIFLALTLATHGGYLAHTIGSSPSSFDWELFKKNFLELSHHPFFITVTVVALISSAKCQHRKLLLSIAGVPLLVGLISLGKFGMGIKALIPASAGVAIALGASYKLFSDEEHSPVELKWLGTIVIFITLTLSLLFKVDTIKGWHEKVKNIQKYRAENPASELIKSVTPRGALVFSQLPDLPIYVERLPLFSDTQLVAEMLRYGLWDPLPFEDALENRKILAILSRRMLKPAMAGGVFTLPIVKIITRNYKLLPFRAEGYFLYVPQKPE